MLVNNAYCPTQLCCFLKLWCLTWAYQSLSVELSVKIRLFESMQRGLVPNQYALCEWVRGSDSF